MTARFERVAVGLVLALSVGCGRGDMFGDNFSIGGPSTGASGGGSGGGPAGGSGGSPSGGGTGLPTSTGIAGPGGNSGATVGSAGGNGTSNGGIGSGGQGASGGFTSGNAGSGTGVNSASGSAGAGTGGTGATVGGSGIGSSGGSNASGGSDNGNGTGGTGGATDGGPDDCDGSAAPVEFVACQTNSDCGCPMSCADDPFQGQVCESPCLQTSDCPDLTTFCNGTSCQVNICGGASGNGTLNSTCDVTGTNDGTCTPFQVTSDGSLVGICTEGGTATVCCDTRADRNDENMACVAGMLCSGGGPGKGAVCGNACDPIGDVSCPAGQTCDPMVDVPGAGACFGFPLPKC